MREGKSPLLRGVFCIVRASKYGMGENMEDKQQATTNTKLVGALVGATVVFWLLSLVLPTFFTKGGGDWNDGVYGNAQVLLADQIRAGYVAGFLGAGYLAAQISLTFWLTRQQTLVRRIILLVGVLLISFVIATSFGASQMAEYRLGGV